jgi:hypothetical protein
MFPPVRVESLRDAVKGLFDSMHGCNDYLSGNGSIEEPAPNKITVKMVLINMPNAKAKKALTEYTRLYLRECGWTVRGATIEAGVLRLKLTPRR